MEKARLLAEHRDNLWAQGTAPHRSFLDLPNEVILSRASKLGVSLGLCPSETANSISSLKNTEETRNLTFLKNTLKITVGNDVQSMVISKAYNLSEDLDHEEEEELMDHLDPGNIIVKNTRKRGTKKGVGLSVQRRSARIEKLRKNSQ